MKRKERFSYPAVGGSSLLTIFAVLCMSIFTLLTIVSVRADLRLSDAGARAVSDYYAAENQAEQIFARLRQGETVSQAEREGDCWRYSCPISENQSLEVTLRCRGGQWEVLRWQTVAWEPEILPGTLPVWNGSE